jgi:hypothetical protein
LFYCFNIKNRKQENKVIVGIGFLILGLLLKAALRLFLAKTSLRSVINAKMLNQ